MRCGGVDQHEWPAFGPPGGTFMNNYIPKAKLIRSLSDGILQIRCKVPLTTD